MHSEEAEKSVLGSMIMVPAVISDAMAIIGKDDFFVSKHQAIFEAVTTRYLENKPIDPILVQGQWDGDPAYLLEICEFGCIPANTEYYAKEIRDKARYREILLATDTMAKLVNPNRDIGELLTDIQDVALGIGRDWETEDYINAVDIAGDVIASHHENDERIPTGLHNMDWLIGGMGLGELIVVAGRPGQGKSALCLNIVQRQDCRCLIISLEMSKKALVRRVLGSLAHIDMTNKKLSDEQYQDLTNAVGEVVNIFISTNAYTVPKIQALIKRVKPELLVVDHVGLMSGRGTKKIEIVTEISRKLKLLAVQENIPVILISQLNRQVENRESKKPRLSDLRDSGALEQDADMVWMLYRAKYYDPKLDDNTAQVRIAKNRRGRLGTAELVFLEDYVSFEDAARI
jgi:replicative DNA helicase